MTTRKQHKIVPDAPEDWFLKIQAHTSARARARVEGQILTLRDSLELRHLSGVLNYADLPESLSVMLYSHDFQNIWVNGRKYHLTVILSLDLTRADAFGTYLIRSQHDLMPGVGRTFLTTNDVDDVLVWLNNHLPLRDEAP